MLASLALQLLVLAQSPAPSSAPPDQPAMGAKLAEDAQQDTPPAQASPGEAPPPQANPPLPRKPGTAPAPAPRSSTEWPEEEPPPPGNATPSPAAPNAVPLAPPAARPMPPAQLSLLSAEPLAGGSAALAQVGWSSISLMYAQGLTATDDLGGLLDLDWAKTELRLGAWYRRPLGNAGPFRMAGRLAAAWYADFGGRFVYGDNRYDRGFEVAPGLSLSSPGAGGIFSVIGEAPVTVTVKRGAGLLFSPRFSVAYEAPLYDPYTVGVRAGLGYRGGSGDAPLRDGRAELTFLLVGGARLF